MKQLLYAICFGACALSFFDMHAVDTSRPGTFYDLLESEGPSSEKEKMLLTYDYAAVLKMLEEKLKEANTLNDMLYCKECEVDDLMMRSNIEIYGECAYEVDQKSKSKLDKINSEIDDLIKKGADIFKTVNDVASMAEKANLPKGTSPMTEEEFNSIMKKVEGIKYFISTHMPLTTSH